jgi:hypothetical protein
MKKTLLEEARDWKQSAKDPFGHDKKIFLTHMVNHYRGKDNPCNIDTILKTLRFGKPYTRETFQHQILVPLREEDNVFIGTGKKGIYLITDKNAAIETIQFYSRRIHSERKHLKNLFRLANRKGLFQSAEILTPDKRWACIYFDESGTPSSNNIDQDPYFIVTGTLIKDKKSKLLLQRKFDLIRQSFNKGDNFEIKSTAFKPQNYNFILTELSTLDYEFASVCFHKKLLVGEGFSYPKSFYKYAYRFLLENLVESVLTADLYFDQYSNTNSTFSNEFITYIKKNQPIIKSDQIQMVDSRQYPGIQLSDLISGVIRVELEGSGNLLHLIEEKKIDIIHFP